MENLIALTIALIAGFLIYKFLVSLFKVLPESGFRTFMLSYSGQVFTGFIALGLLYVGYVCIMVYILGIRC